MRFKMAVDHQQLVITYREGDINRPFVRHQTKNLAEAHYIGLDVGDEVLVLLTDENDH